MATLTGSNLLDSIIDSTGIEPNALIQATLSARLQQLIDDGTFSNLAAALAMSGFSTEINAGTEVPLLSDTIDTNVGLIEAAAEDEVDDIDFPDYGGPAPITYTLTASADQINEGDANTFTVEASRAVDADTDVVFQLRVDADGDTAQLEDFNAGAFNPVTVTIAAGETTATFDLTAITNDGTEVSEKYTMEAAVDGQTLSTQVTILDGDVGGGQTFTLTTGLDIIPGMTGSNGNTVTSGDDTIIGTVDAGGDDTLNATDVLDAGEGVDLLKIIAATALTDADIPFFENIEALEVRGSDAITLDTTGQTGLDTLDVTLGVGAVSLTAADTTNVDVSGARDAITVIGGNDVYITDETADAAIQIGDGTDDPAGTIMVTDTAQGTGGIAIDGGTTVDVTTTVTIGTTTIGATTPATGAVTVSATAAEAEDDTDVTMGAIDVTGGTVVDVAVSAGEDVAAEFATGTTITQSDVTVTGDDSTTEVTITQDAAVTEDTYTEAVEEVKETTVVTFDEMDADETLIINGLTFTASKDLTAAEVAQAFAGLTEADTQTAGGPTGNGIYTGAFDTAVWTTGTADGDTVTFTAQDDDEADITFGGTATAPTQVKSTGTLGVDGNDGVLGVVGGAAVVIDQDGADATIETINLDAYGAGSDIQGADALTSLNLANVDDIDLTVDAAVISLDVAIDNITGGSVIDLDDSAGAANATLETLNISVASDSDADIIADTVMTLNVSGDGELVTTAVASTFAALETVVVTGAAGLTLTGTDETVLESIDASGTTGDVSASIDTGIAAAASIDTAYMGGSGADTVTLVTDTTVEAGVDLGDGDDKLFLTASTTAIIGDVDGGNGDDIISMDTTSAIALGTKALDATGFEILELTGAAGGESVDVATLGFDSVIVDGGVADDGGFATEDFELILDSGSTVEVNDLIGLVADTDTMTLTVNDADTGEADSVNLVLTNEASVNFGTVIANDVESLSITANDVFSDTIEEGVDDNDANHTLLASGDSVETITIDGDDLTLDTDSTVLTSVDASAMTGGITYTADGAAAGTTVLGGEGADVLIGDGSNDILDGGAGDDILTGDSLTELTGGDGADTFVMNVPTNVNSYSTIMDFEAGDVLQLTAGSVFVAAGIDLADTAVFQDYANEAINQLVASGTDDAAWFNYDGNTYVVENGAGDAVDDFINGEDSIIRIVGIVDLSEAASYNETAGTLEMA